ncbi:MAG: EF-P lysine aminoacylase EpmA [bacterium]
MLNPNEENDTLKAALPFLKLRSATLQAVRRFFTDRQFVEVDTPVRIPAPAMELHIDAVPSDGEYLRTSPELHMKRLLAAGCSRMFQVGPCFRKNERGRLHNPEYTMLEWYRADANYHDVLVDAKALMKFVALEVLGRTSVIARGKTIELAGEWEYRTVADAFGEYAGWNPVTRFNADRFDVDLVNKVEPGLPALCPTVLADYPAECAALARRKPGDARVAERWELYIGGVELANAFSELIDPAEQRDRFAKCAAMRRDSGSDVYPIDEQFIASLANMPPSAGVAMGVDRLVMLLAGLESLDLILPFREPVGA